MIKNTIKDNHKAGVPKIVLVVGWSGINTVYNHVVLGILDKFKDAGIQIESVVGCGGGSFIGSLWACGYDVSEIQEFNRQLVIPETKYRTKYFLLLKHLFPAVFRVEPFFYFRDDKLINQCINNIFSDSKFENPSIPLCISTVDYITGEQVLISSGSISKAVRISLAQPLLYKPVPADDRFLVDGSLTEPLPVGVAIQSDADIIISLIFDSKKRKPNDSISNFVINLTGIMSSNALEATLSFYNLIHDKELIAIIPDLPQKRFSKSSAIAPEAFEFGGIEASKHIPYLKKLVSKSSGK